MGKLIPLVLLILGSGAGYGAGLMVAPAPTTGNACADGNACGPDVDTADDDAAQVPGDGRSDADGNKEFFALSSQFVIPVLERGKARALVVMALSLEVAEGSTSAVYALEPRLRDGMLQVLFDHANSGGFDGRYTETRRLDALRRALLESARSVAGKPVRDVLITELVRQEA